MTFFFCNYKKLDESVTTLQYGIWGNLNLCFHAMVTQI